VFCGGEKEYKRRSGTPGRREMAEKEGRGMNTVQTTYTHACKCKNDTC
jgi:hypothetical protein